MVCVVRDYSDSKPKDRQCKQNNRSYKTEIKIRANPGLAYLGFEQLVLS